MNEESHYNNILHKHGVVFWHVIEVCELIKWNKESTHFIIIDSINHFAFVPFPQLNSNF
jgi:hypothetical protein